MQAASKVFGRMNIEDARQSAAIPSGEAARHQRHIVHSWIDERAEQSAEVKGIVDRIAVDEDEILIRLAAANVQAGREIVACFDTGQQLHDANDVRLTEF